MKKKNNKVEEFIRVDHAGERGAVKIYEGQLLALNTLVKNEDLKIFVKDYYFSNVIARSSKTMLNCYNSKLETKRTGTEG